MKRLMPSGLITWLQANPAALKADLFLITLPTGTLMYATEGQFDITVSFGTPGWDGGTVVFKAMTYGRWARGPITSEATFGCNANTMMLTCVPLRDVVYPGLTIGILNGAYQGLFDAAKVEVFTAYMPLGSYGDVSHGIETKWLGTVTKITDINRVKVEFECADPFYLLNMKVPTRLIQSNCPWGFADSNCKLVAATYTQAFTAKAGSDNRTLIPVSAFSQATDYFTQGVVKCVTGANAGLSQTVKSHTGGNLLMTAAWILPIAAGDTFTVIAGCNKTLTACKTRKTAAGASVDNSINFGGMPYCPVPNRAF
jgi:uncharacterized phage protein (TIGR02218 family)